MLEPKYNELGAQNGAIQSENAFIEMLAKSGLFCSNWYAASYKDVAESGLIPIDHYMQIGRKENRSPCESFDAKEYADRWAAAFMDNETAIDYYFRVTAYAGASESSFLHKIFATRLFDEYFYASQNSDVVSSGLDPLTHYAMYGAAENRAPSAKFDPSAYMLAYVAHPKPPVNAMGHYISNIGNKDVLPIPFFNDETSLSFSSIPLNELLRSSNLFDAGWYVSYHSDLKELERPLEHFLNFGLKEGRDPSERFQSQWYFEEYNIYSMTSPLEHYLRYGQVLGFHPAPKSSFKDWSHRYKNNKSLMVPSEPKWLTNCIVTKVQFDIDPDRGLRTACEIIGCRPVEVDKSRNILWIFYGADVTLDPGILENIKYYFDHQAACVYSDVLFQDASDDEIGGYFLPSFSPRYFAARPSIVRMFVLNVLPSSIPGLEQASTIESAWRSVLNTNCITFRHAPHFLYSVPSRHTLNPNGKVAEKGMPNGAGGLSFSIIIPTRDHVDILRACVNSIVNSTTYEGYFEIIIVDNGSVEPETLQYFTILENRFDIKVLSYPRPFNFSAINNYAAHHSAGNVLLFLNNDTVIIRPDWLDIFARQLNDRNTGVVGVKLLYPDYTIQHSGVVVGIQGVAAHSHVNLRPIDPGFQGENLITREVTAVTGACMAVRKQIFDLVGGFDTDFEVAFNDIAFCVAVGKLGLQNVVVSESVALHYESKSRGYDTTREKRAKFAEERRLFNLIYWMPGEEDRYYNSNLSLDECYDLAKPPRSIKPWRVLSTSNLSASKILVLSSTFAAGHGVAVVIKEQCQALITLGFQIILGGPKTRNDIEIGSVDRVMVSDAQAAARYAVRNEVDVIIAHTPPFFSVIRYIGLHPAVVLYDYGEPSPSYFPDWQAREDINKEKELAFSMARYKAAISEAVRREGDGSSSVLPLANSHIAARSREDVANRNKIRSELGWSEKKVLLCVCRFHKAERYYKGVDRYADICARLCLKYDNIVPVLVGKGTTEDSQVMEGRGLSVFANVSDERLRQLYLASDIFISLSRWEGYNLPLAQALALGIPVVASKIPAHEAFGIETYAASQEVLLAVEGLISSEIAQFVPKIWEWSESVSQFCDFINNALADTKKRVYSSLFNAPVHIQWD